MRTRVLALRDARARRGRGRGGHCAGRCRAVVRPEARAERRDRRSTPNWCSRSTFPIRWIRKSSRCSARLHRRRITSREFMQALKAGMHGQVAVTYFEWADVRRPAIIVPWRLIDGPEAADGVAAEIARAAYRRASRTSISGALLFAKPLFERQRLSRHPPRHRRVGRRRQQQRPAGDAWCATRCWPPGITINGLPIMLKRPNTFTMDIENLDVYYEDCVIGGPGAFVIPIKRARAIQGGDPHQAGARSRRPHAAGARGAGGGQGSRASPAPSASRCGSSAGAIDTREPRDDLDMR